MKLLRRRALILALPTLALLPSQASALEGAGGCQNFPWTQTYGTWGPSQAYGRTVTVVYVATHCEEGAGAMRASGIATIHRGRTDAGEVLDVLPFANDVSWSGKRFRWWTCTPSAGYRWEIDGVYSFAATASDGMWTLDVDPGRDGPLHWSYEAC